MIACCGGGAFSLRGLRADAEPSRSARAVPTQRRRPVSRVRRRTCDDGASDEKTNINMRADTRIHDTIYLSLLSLSLCVCVPVCIEAISLSPAVPA